MTQFAGRINGFTLDEALDAFDCIGTSSQPIRAWVYDKLHPGDVSACPSCGEQIISIKARKTFRDGGRVCCLSCKKFFTNRTNTILHGSQLEFEQVYLIAVLTAFAFRTSADASAARREISKIVGLHPDSIKHWQKIFSALETPIEF